MEQELDVSLPEKVKPFNGYMLLKFTTCYDYQKDFLDGKLFFNTSDFFAKCDDEGRGDPDEGSTFIVDYENPNLIAANMEKIGDKYAIVVRDYTNNPQAYKQGTVWDYSKAINRNRKILCMYTMLVDIERQTIDSFPDKMGEEFGQYGVLILNRQEFFKRVVSAIKRENTYSLWGLGFVDYLSQDQQQGFMEWHPFIKKGKFDYQKEFRITFVSSDSQAIKLDLGCSLRDIAVPIMAKDLTEIYFKDGQLLYPRYEIVETDD